MSSLGTALEIGRSALRAQQIGLNVAGNNIANVNTPGYARKSVKLEATSVIGTRLGTGANVGSLTRARDRFLDSQFRFEGGNIGRLEVLEQAMSSVEAIFTEVAGGGTTETGAVFNQGGGAALSGAFSRFFNAFEDLANNPTSQAARAQVREEGVFITDQFHRIYNELSELRDDINGEVGRAVADVNRLTEEIGRLNTKILVTKADPLDVAGNLEDERDRLVDEISKLMDISVREETDGTLTVSGAEGEGIVLVSGKQSLQLATRPVIRDNATVSDLVLAGTGTQITLTKGRLQGLIEARDGQIIDFRDSLDTLADTLVSTVNAVHAGGFGLDGSSGNTFFEANLTDARLISLSSEVMSSLDKIATAGPSSSDPSMSAGTGDGSVALALSDLRSEKSLGGGSQTVEEYYSDLVGRVGAEAKKVFTEASSERLVLEQVSNRRENVRGVSINEEASDLILFQRAYQAAARLVSIVDEMMESILSI